MLSLKALILAHVERSETKWNGMPGKPIERPIIWSSFMKARVKSTTWPPSASVTMGSEYRTLSL